jgi:hypothetical protein
MEASQHSLLAACFTLHSINATLAIVPQRGAGLWITKLVSYLVYELVRIVCVRMHVGYVCRPVYACMCIFIYIYIYIYMHYLHECVYIVCANAI